MNQQPPKKRRGRPKTNYGGVTNSNGWKPKPTQMAMAILMINAEDRRTIEEKAREVGINKKTYYDWLKIPDYLEFMNKLSKDWLKSQLYKVNQCLMREIGRGVVPAMRTYYELNGEINQKVTSNNVHVNSGGQTGDIIFQMAEPPDREDDEGEELEMINVPDSTEVEIPNDHQ